MFSVGPFKTKNDNWFENSVAKVLKENEFLDKR